MPSQVTVTATLQDVSAAAQAQAFVRFILRGFTGFVPQVQGTAVVAETQIDAIPNGSGQISVSLWPNNAITPSSTFYTVQYWSNGRITSSANYLINAVTDLDTAAQLNAPPVPAGFSLVLEHNGALNSSQSTLNLVNTDGTVTITDLGSGNIQLNAAGSVIAGTNVTQTPSWGGSTVFPQNGVFQSSANTLGGTFFQQVSAGMLLCNPSKWKVTIYTVGAATITLVIIKCTRGTGTVVSSAAVTFGGQATPAFGGAGLHQSDAISFALTGGFDYYFAMNSSSNLIGILAPGTVQAGVCGGSQITNGNALPIGASLPSWTSSISQGSNQIIFDFVSA